jgi:phosphatidylserine/phosphatidylglycerophosphate/cardiolipin synthase-like enzyme
MNRSLPFLMAFAACAPPDVEGLFNDINLTIVEGGPAANALMIDTIEQAQFEVRIALPGLTDLDLTDAIIAASEDDRDLDVYVVVDIDQASDAGVAQLIDAGIAVTLADDAITYFDFGLNVDVAWTSDQTHMTHAFVASDSLHFAMTSTAGDILDGVRPVYHGTSEELAEDLVSEHIQVFGGSDATAVTAFDATAKSVADLRWVYPTQADEMFELWFNPQERLIKRVIDAVYRARSSIRIMTDDFADEGLARALQQKAEDGFDVEVLVGSTFATTSPALTDVLLEQAPDVSVLQIEGNAPIPTMAFIDFDKARDGRFHAPTTMVLTHPVWSAARLFSEQEVLTDQLVDGALYVMSVRGAPTTPLQRLAELYQVQRQDAESIR